MKEILININKKEILDEVSLNTAYAGAKTQGEAGIFERVAAIEADEALLSKFWLEMTGQLAETLQGFIKSAEHSQTALKLNLETSGAYDESLTPSLVEDVKAALAAGITQRWFTYTLPSRAEEFCRNSELLLKRIISKLCHRKKPVRQ